MLHRERPTAKDGFGSIASGCPSVDDFLSTR